MAGLAIHVLSSGTKNVDARDKPGHDELRNDRMPQPWENPATITGPSTDRLTRSAADRAIGPIRHPTAP
jgi:hypothetical protein